MTGSLRLRSVSKGRVNEMTSTVPRLVPSHKQGHVSASNFEIRKLIHIWNFKHNVHKIRNIQIFRTKVVLFKSKFQFNGF